MTERCARCGKPVAICVCDRLVVHETKTRVLVLQHPQEPDVDLGTAPLLALSLPSCVVRVGLSWPSLSAALGEDAEPKDWGVLYPLSLPSSPLPLPPPEPGCVIVGRKGVLRKKPLDGIVALDGTWSQAKSTWWRNPWLLRLCRVVLTPRDPSIYGKLRAEPRTSHVSTLEAVADALVANGEDVTVRDDLRRAMRTMVQRARDRK